MTVSIVLSVLVISSIIITVLVLYAIGKIRNIEELMARTDKPAAVDIDPNASFAGLDGKPLWDMLTGRSVPTGVATAKLEDFRKMYTPVLGKAIKMVCADGLSDGQFGKPRLIPKNVRPVKTLRHTVQAWLPSHEVSGLYNASYDAARAEGDDLARVHMSLEELSNNLFSKLNVDMPSGFFESLQVPAGEVQAITGDSMTLILPEQKDKD